VIKKAGSEKITMVGITDHDTTAGLGEALEASRASQVRVVPGVELSVDFRGGAMHLCGYGFDIENRALQEKLAFARKGRSERNLKIIDRLKTLGVKVSAEDLAEEAGKEMVSRVHFSKVLLRKGYARDIKEAFSRFLARGAPAYVDRVRLQKKEALDMVLGAGGVVVLAHPAQLKLGSPAGYREEFKELRKLGAAGIEAYSSHHSEEENAMFKRLADELGMFVTGGSDFHGDLKPGVELGCFGEDVRVNTDVLYAVRKK
jgi:predicted metal-dependent phosphoesterase TrpH